MNKIIKLWKSCSDSKKSALVFMLASYIHYAISFLVTPLFSRLLSTADFGLVTNYNSWVQILEPIATLSVYAGFFNVGMLDNEDRRDSFTSSMSFLSLASTVVTMTVFCIITIVFPRFVGLPFVLIVLMVVYFLTYPSTRIWQAKERFFYKYKALFVVMIITGVLSPALGLLLVIIARNDLGIVRLVGTNIITIAIGVFFFFYLWKKGKKTYDKQLWKVALAFCVPLVPHYLAMHILSASDKIMITNMIGQSEAGIYGMAYTASMVITSAWSAINGSLNPYMLRHLKVGDYRSVGKSGQICIIGFSVLCLMICIIAPEVIFILGGDKYNESIKIIPPLMASVLFMEMYNLFSTVEFYHKKTKSIMVATACAAVLNLALNFVFIKLFGYVAAAYTTLICYILYCVFHYINMRRMEKNTIYDINLLSVFSIIYVTACFACLATYDHPLVRYGLLLLVVLIAFTKRKTIISFLAGLRAS